MEEFARLGSATVYEASGRQGLIDADPAQVVPGSRAARSARTLRRPAPVALLADLLPTQAKVHGAAAVLVDASVRDVEELAELGVPIWARWVRVKGAGKDGVGSIGQPVTVGGA